MIKINVSKGTVPFDTFFVVVIDLAKVYYP